MEGWRRLLRHFIWCGGCSFNRLPVKENLLQRNIQLSSNSSRCVFCNALEESVSQWMDYQIVHPDFVNDHFLQHPFYLVTKSEIFKWRVVWCSWNLWNQCIFNGGTFDKESLIQNILFTAWSWLNGLSAGFSYWFAQWCICPGACIMRVIWRCIDNLEHVCVEWEYSKSYESE